MRRALYISHTGMTEPLGQSQVIAYVQGLVASGWDIDILAFEPARTSRERIAEVEAQLRDAGIGYHWRRRSPSHGLPVKLWEAGGAVMRLLGQALRKRPRIIHARSYLPGAVAGTVAALAPGARFLFDVRGLLGEEYVDAGHWTAQSLNYRLLKRAERLMLNHARGVVVLTERHRQWLDEQGFLARRPAVEVIPCCVDLQRYQASPADRSAVRTELQAGDRFVLVYSGTLGSWYRAEDMARLFAAIRRRRPALFAVYTQSDPGIMRSALARADVPDSEVVIRGVAPGQMPRYLSAGDAAVSFITRCFSKLSSSPTKIAEYLALGLPVVMNRGIGDSDQLIDEVPAVVDARDLTPEQIDDAAARAVALDRDDIRTVARRAAEQRFSLTDVGIHRYRRIYEALLG